MPCLRPGCLIPDQDGSATLVAFGFLLLVVALAGGMVALTQTGSRQRLERLTRTEARTQALNQARAAMQTLARGGVPGPGVTVSDASSALNPNWVRADLLEKTPFGTWLLPGRSPASFAQDRVDHGLAVEAEARWSDWFRLDLLKSQMTVLGPWPVNVADEVALELAFEQRTGDAVAAQRFREGVRRARQALQPLAPADLAALAGTHREAVLGLFTTAAPWNANTLPENQLRFLMAYPPLGLADPAGSAGLVLQARQKSHLTATSLAKALGLPPQHPLLLYLGTDTQVWKLAVRAGDETLVSYWQRDPSSPEGQPGDYHPLSRSWVTREEL